MKEAISWIIAVIITFSIMIFQFIQGMTYSSMTELNTGKQRVEFELRRTYSGKTDCPVILPIEDITVSGYLMYRIYPASDSMSRIDLKREGDLLVAKLPNQMPDSNLAYQIFLEKAGSKIEVNDGKETIIKFLGDIPIALLFIYILMVFFALFYSNATGVYALAGIKAYKWMTYVTIIALVSVEFIIQPLMHKYALNRWWTGIPFNWDINENKILIALTVWVVVLFINRKKARPIVVILASIVSILIFFIPYSRVPGSEPDPFSIKFIHRNLLPLLQLY